MKTRILVAALLGGVGVAPAGAQERLTEHTFRLAKGSRPPAATLSDMAWLTGHWTGQALGGLSEEIWSAPAGGAMMGMFRLVRDGRPAFYELLTIVEHEGSLLMRLKHFNPDLTGWEEKDRTVDFPLVARTADGVHFEGMSFHPAADGVRVHLAVRQKDGTHREETFHYGRAPSAAAPRAPADPLTEADAESLRQAEAGFAASFAARDPQRFTSFLEDAATFVGPQRTLRGKAEVREVWARMMLDGPTPPFSWRPERVAIDGDLGLSSGPVFDRSGKQTGAFASVWRRQPDGAWRILLDMAPPCPTLQ